MTEEDKITIRWSTNPGSQKELCIVELKSYGLEAWGPGPTKSHALVKALDALTRAIKKGGPKGEGA